MKEKRTKKEKRIIFAAFTVTLCLLLVFIGVFVVDYKGRSMSFGDTTPIFQVTEHANGTASLKINAFGSKNSFDITRLKNFWDKFCEFCCIPNG